MSSKPPLGGLSAVAASMKRQAERAASRHAFRRLQHGLAIVYGQRDNQWRLAIGRLAPSAPSDQEKQIVANAFDVPYDFEPVHRQAQWWDPIDERNRTFNVLEITWRVVELRQDFGVSAQSNAQLPPVAELVEAVEA